MAAARRTGLRLLCGRTAAAWRLAATPAAGAPSAADPDCAASTSGHDGPSRAEGCARRLRASESRPCTAGTEPSRLHPSFRYHHRAFSAAGSPSYDSLRPFATQASSEGAKDWDGGESMADQMIEYWRASRSKAPYVEALRILEQGLSFLVQDGQAAGSATGRILMALATIHIDQGHFAEAGEALEKAAGIPRASYEVRAAALEALASLALRQHQDEAAMSHATCLLRLVDTADRGTGDHRLVEILRDRALTIMGFIEHIRHRLQPAEDLFKEAGAWHDEVDVPTSSVLMHAEHLHALGDMTRARDLYSTALRMTSPACSQAAVAAGPIAPEEVHMGSLAGLGQLACHLGEYDEAEAKLAEALSHAEEINGEKHPRVGVVLAALASVYDQRGRARGSGDVIMAEGLYRRALELLRASEPSAYTDRDDDFVDVIALTRGRCANVLGWAKNRETEADRLRQAAKEGWAGEGSLENALAESLGSADAASSTDGSSEDESKGTQNIEAPEWDEDVALAAKREARPGEGRCVVLDVRLGRQWQLAYPAMGASMLAATTWQISNTWQREVYRRFSRNLIAADR
eukprot:SM000048S16531  [mRNA]  locus=s48:218276:223505:- [translate_table: standard]